jgi:hypothetical protein
LLFELYVFAMYLLLILLGSRRSISTRCDDVHRWSGDGHGAECDKDW